jgi:hypothetical protein
MSAQEGCDCDMASAGGGELLSGHLAIQGEDGTRLSDSDTTDGVAIEGHHALGLEHVCDTQQLLAAEEGRS